MFFFGDNAITFYKICRKLVGIKLGSIKVLIRQFNSSTSDMNAER
jgi:hypothetical protein